MCVFVKMLRLATCLLLGLAFNLPNLAVAGNSLGALCKHSCLAQRAEICMVSERKAIHIVSGSWLLAGRRICSVVHDLALAAD